MAADSLMTDAKVALNFRMQRHFADSIAREGAAIRATERAAKRLSCDCVPLNWEYQPLRTRTVYPFAPVDSQNGGLYRQASFYYTGILSQSRIFAQLEVYEMPVIDPCQITELAEFDRRIGNTSCSIVVKKDEDVWNIRKEIHKLFIKAIHRPVDALRLTIVSGASGLHPPDPYWVHQGIREFFIGNGNWLTADVYEANSAERGRV